MSQTSIMPRSLPRSSAYQCCSVQGPPVIPAKGSTPQSHALHVAENECRQPLGKHLVQSGHFTDEQREVQNHRAGPSISLCLGWELNNHLTGCLEDQSKPCMRGCCTPGSMWHDLGTPLPSIHSFPTGEPRDQQGIYYLTQTTAAQFSE